jgi:hypothetical protein
MRRSSVLVSSAFLLFSSLVLLQRSTYAQQEIVVPAGTLLRCTMNEPNFSTATAQVGDPVLCHLSGITEFGRAAFPRGSYLGGHLEAAKDPGHFWGKGYLKVVFDRIGLPNTDATLDAKIVAARGYKVNRDGDILGKGHAKRDVIEWMIPPLWPWKLLMLPARGPRPVLKGEQTLTLRLMEDVAIPRVSAAVVPSRDWHAPVYAPQSRLRDNADSPSWATHPSAYLAAQAASQERVSVASSVSAGARPRSAAVHAAGEQVLSDLPLADVASRDMLLASLPEEPTASKPNSQAFMNSAAGSRSSLTLLALKNETIYPVTRYWVESERVSYVLPSGASGEVALSELDWQRTIELNAQLGVAVTLRTGPSRSAAITQTAANGQLF